MVDERYAVLFEPVAIGPVTARNRFFQVPHCNGLGFRHPRALAAMRGVKAEGGWAVVCTEETEIHPTSDISGAIELRNWDDRDVAALSLIPAAIHEHGSLAGIELVHGGIHAPNRTSRLAPLAASDGPATMLEPVQARAMTLAEIAELRRWHRDAVRRSLAAGFDLVYVYAGHTLSVIQEFLSPRTNQRGDAYGGSLANRARLLRELLDDAREECDGRAAVGCRLCVDELIGDAGLVRSEVTELVGMLGELPDLWDFQVGEWADDSVTARFADEGYQEAAVRGLKELTTKPVVGVGRFTSPDLMVRQIRSGVLDLIGAARPSIADPFLPNKLAAGDFDHVRECIGCNICVSGDNQAVPIRCTQNPTMGEEYRRGWHPERVATTDDPRSVLVVGGGPAGLEAARVLGETGNTVALLEATNALGGRVLGEAALPGLASYRRVIDYRLAAIERLDNVTIYRQSPVDAALLAEFGFAHVVVATGSRWCADGVGRSVRVPLDVGGLDVYTPDDLFAGRRPAGGRVVVFDDDHYYLGGVVAESLATGGCDVVIVTPEPLVSAWTVHTLEQRRIHRRLHGVGVQIRTQHTVAAAAAGSVDLVHVVTGERAAVPADAVVMVTSRRRTSALYDELLADPAAFGVETLTLAGDVAAPSTVAAAVWSGYHAAATFTPGHLGPVDDSLSVRRELLITR